MFFSQNPYKIVHWFTGNKDIESTKSMKKVPFLFTRYCLAPPFFVDKSQLFLKQYCLSPLFSGNVSRFHLPTNSGRILGEFLWFCVFFVKKRDFLKNKFPNSNSRVGGRVKGTFCFLLFLGKTWNHGRESPPKGARKQKTYLGSPPGGLVVSLLRIWAPAFL